MARDIAGVSGKALMAVTAFASAYYLAAHLVFPRNVEAQPNFDAHFFRVRRIVIGILFALLLCQLGWYASIPSLAAHLMRPLPVALTLALVALMLAAMLVRGPRRSAAAMSALVCRYVLVYLL